MERVDLRFDLEPVVFMTDVAQRRVGARQRGRVEHF